MEAVGRRLQELAERFGLPAGAAQQLQVLLRLVAEEPSAITTIRDPAAAVDHHVADSLVALDLDDVRAAQRLADLGSGGGFPGLVLAVALPQTEIALVESVGKKCDFLRSACAAMGLRNVDVVNARAEEWTAGIDRHDVIAARALAPLTVLLEYAAPLLRVGGALVAWKGRRDASEETDGRAAAEALGMTAPEPQAVQPFRSALDRHLYVSVKQLPTPAGYPRRVGMARKRPIRALPRA